jgi:hypothetical protein
VNQQLLTAERNQAIVRILLQAITDLYTLAPRQKVSVKPFLTIFPASFTSSTTVLSLVGAEYHHIAGAEGTSSEAAHEKRTKTPTTFLSRYGYPIN